MKEIVKNKKRTPLTFRCKLCGKIFISNEYKSGMMLPSSGRYPSATEECKSCGKTVKGGIIYRPLIGSKEREKWYG